MSPEELGVVSAASKTPEGVSGGGTDGGSNGGSDGRPGAEPRGRHAAPLVYTELQLSEVDDVVEFMAKHFYPREPLVS